MLVISPQQPCGIGRYSLVSGNSPMRASDPTNHLQCLLQSIKVSPRRDEGIPPYRLLALPAAYYKKLCRERLIPVQEPNQRSGWPLKFDCGRRDLPYIFRITLPAKNLSPFYPIRPEKYVDKPRFIWYIIQAIFCGHGPLVKRLRQRPLTPLTWVRFPHGSPKNTPAYAGVFFRVSCARNRTGRCAAAHKKQSSGLFLARGRFPRVSPETLQLMLECFFVYPVRGIEQGGALQRTKNSPVDCFLARGRFPRVSPEPLQLMLEWFFVYPVRGIEQGSAPQRTKNSPVDCFLARGRFPRVSPETLQLMLECFFVYPVREIEPDGAQVLLCAIMERCFLVVSLT